MISQIPSTYIMELLLLNPGATSFPLGGHGLGADVPRSVLVNEINQRPSTALIEHLITIPPTPAAPAGQRLQCKGRMFV